jgi:hypothetical protein
MFGSGPVPTAGGYQLPPLVGGAFAAYFVVQLIRDLVQRRRRWRSRHNTESPVGDLDRHA